jgi:hypothetical protein
MPMQSKAQRRFLWARHPEIAERWEKHTPKSKKLPEHVKKSQALGESELKRMQLFKVGFLCGLAERGMLPSEFQKAADNLISSTVGSGIKGVGDIAGGAVKAVPGLLKGLLIAPALAGAYFGFLKAKLTSPGKPEMEAMQSAEQIGTYRRMTDSIHRRLRLKKQRETQESRGLFG